MDSIAKQLPPAAVEHLRKKMKKRNGKRLLAKLPQKRFAYAAIKAILPELDGIFTVKREGRAALKAFLGG